jgi:hypothetical protein
MIDTVTTTRSETIGRLNDRCRQGLDRTARITVTRACLGALSTDSLASQAIAQAHLLQELRRHRFADGDALRERGEFTIDDTRVYFTIDYYDQTLEWGAEDPADASITRRVLTMMLREDM